MPASPHRECFAITAPGLEALTADELVRLGLTPTGTEPGGVSFLADAAGLYAANLHLRTASRVVVRVASFHAAAFHELERRARRLPWEELVAPGMALDFRVTSRKSRLYHQDAISERLVKLVAERVPGIVVGPAGPADDANDGDDPADVPDVQRFVVRIVRDECAISVDSSGALLHRRGYRLATAKAPLRETLGAAMLLAAGWPTDAALLDPFCGSGTIPIEAALLARRIAPGLGRTFAFERWPAFESRVWERVRADAVARMLPKAPAPIQGSDRDPGAIEASLANAARAGVGEDVEFARGTVSTIAPPPGPGWLITNPPYGVRVGERLKLRNLFAQLGNVARQRAPGWTLAMLSLHRELEAQTGLDLASRFETTNGGLRVRCMTGVVPALAPANA